MVDTRFIEHGRRQLRSTPEYRDAVARIRQDVERDYAPLVSEAGVFERVWLRVQRYRVIRQRVAALASQESLF